MEFSISLACFNYRQVVLNLEFFENAHSNAIDLPQSVSYHVTFSLYSTLMRLQQVLRKLAMKVMGLGAKRDYPVLDTSLMSMMDHDHACHFTRDDEINVFDVEVGACAV